MKIKHCLLCGAIIYEADASDICDVCRDDMEEDEDETENT